MKCNYLISYYGSCQLKNTIRSISLVLFIIFIFLPILRVTEQAQAGTEPIFSRDGDTIYVGEYSIVRCNPPVTQVIHANPRNNNPIFGWGEEIRITYCIDGESTYYAHSPVVASTGDTLALSYSFLLRESPPRFGYDILFSTDFGQIWSDTVNFRNPGGLRSGVSAIALRDSCVLVAGSEARYEINRFFPYFRKGYRFGEYWEEPIFFLPFPGAYFISKIRVVCAGDTVHYSFFQGDRVLDPDIHIDSIYYSRSLDRGDNWEPRVPLTYAPAAPNAPISIAAAGTNVSVIFEDFSDDGLSLEIYQMLSIDGGETWERWALTTPDSIGSQYPVIFSDAESGMVVIWNDYKYGSGPSGFTGNIIGRTSSDGGRTWGGEFRVTAEPWAIASAPFMQGDHIGVAWSDHRTGLFNAEIYFAESLDRGQTWSEETRLTDAINDSGEPRFAIAGQRATLFWEDARHGERFQYEIYMRHYEIETGIHSQEVGGGDGNEFLVYPNPFNSATTITYTNFNVGQIKIFNIEGQLIRTFFTGDEKEGQIEWDACDAEGNKVSSGIYFARAVASQNTYTIKLIYSK
jgi:hypothetical protein